MAIIDKQFIHMKKLICFLAVFVGLIGACSKNNGDGKYCWECHVWGGFPYQDRMMDTCIDDDTDNPQFVDANNNPLNENCTRK